MSREAEDLNGSEYLQRVLGDVLSSALAAVARERPEDPIQFVADYLYRVARERRHERKGGGGRGSAEDDADSGLAYEDREAPTGSEGSSGSSSLPPAAAYASRASVERR